MVELPPSLRTFLAFDFTFASLGKRSAGRPASARIRARRSPRMTSVRKLAEAKTDLGWTDSRIRAKVVRLPEPAGPPLERALPRRGPARRRAAHPRPRQRGHQRPGLRALHGVRPVPLRSGGALAAHGVAAPRRPGVAHRAEPRAADRRRRRRDRSGLLTGGVRDPPDPPHKSEPEPELAAFDSPGPSGDGSRPASASSVGLSAATLPRSPRPPTKPHGGPTRLW